MRALWLQCRRSRHVNGPVAAAATSCPLKGLQIIEANAGGNYASGQPCGCSIIYIFRNNKMWDFGL